MATTKYVNTSNMDSSTINLGNFTADISAHGEEVVFVNALPKLVNLICRPVWIIIGTIGKWLYFASHTLYDIFTRRVTTVLEDSYVLGKSVNQRSALRAFQTNSPTL